MRAWAKAVDGIVDNNTLFPYLMIAISTHFAYMDIYKQMLFVSCTCPNKAVLLVNHTLFSFINMGEPEYGVVLGYWLVLNLMLK